MKRISVLVYAGYMMAACRHQPNKSLTIQLNGADRAFSLVQLKSLLPTQNVTVDDYYLKRRITYRAFPMVALVRSFISDGAQFDELIFRCADGYMAHVSRTDFEAGKLDTFYLATGEGADTFKSLIPQGKAEISPEPFYAVATDPKGFSTLSWPYEIVAIEFVNLRQKFPGIFAAGDSTRSAWPGAAKDGVLATGAPQPGFDIFRRECLKCHSINLSGGDVGPELNVPQNITEYRDKKTLAAFIRNPSAFRAKSKMPAMGQLSETQIGQVIEYLAAMRLHKQPQ